MRFLIFGDVVGRPGRDAVTRALPELRAEYRPDSVIINIENIAHGRGLSPDTMREALAWQADAYTTGDHAWDNAAGLSVLADQKLPLVRPANYPENTLGRSYYCFTKGAFQVAIINLQGQVFFKNHPRNPFHALDELLKKPDIAQSNVILVDFHAEATSEKRALGWYADGRISALWGTHTHVPTADAQLLPNGTAYISDIGMCGNLNSVIGVDRHASLQRFLTQVSFKPSFEETGPHEIGALLLDIDPATKRATHIAQIRKISNL